MLRILILLLFVTNSVVQYGYGQAVLIDGRVEIEKKHFYQKDTIFKEIYFKLLVHGDSLVYLSSDGFYQNIDSNLVPAYGRNDVRRAPLDATVISFLASRKRGAPLKDTIFRPHLDQHELLDSSSLSMRVMDTNFYYVTTMYMMEEVQIMNVSHLATSIAHLRHDEVKVVVDNLIDTLSEIHSEKLSQPETQSTVMTDEMVLKQFSEANCQAELGLGEERKLLVYWYRSCAPCNLLMKELITKNISLDQVLLINSNDALGDQGEYLKKMNSVYNFSSSDCFVPKSYPIVFLSDSDTGVSQIWQGYSSEVVQEILEALDQ